MRRLASEVDGEPLCQHLRGVRPVLEVRVANVTPRSSVIGSYFVRPSPLRMIALPPSLYSITSDDRFSAPTLLTAATGVVLVPK